MLHGVAGAAVGIIQKKNRIEIMKKEKLTKMEQRAKSACDDFNKKDTGTFSIRLKKSEMWGYCPSIMYKGEKCAYAGGCGYNKESTVLSTFLKYLFPIGSDDYMDVATTTNDIDALKQTLASKGWKLHCDYYRRYERGYTLSEWQKGIALAPDTTDFL